MTTVLAPWGRYDTGQPITPVRVAVLTISDTRDEESDTSGQLLADRVTAAGHVLAGRRADGEAPRPAAGGPWPWPSPGRRSVPGAGPPP